MKFIQLTHGMKAIVDDEDYERVNQFKWLYIQVGYVARWTYCDNRRVMIYMHRFIMSAPCGKDVDHKFGNKLDNRKSQLRIATRQQNLRNRGRNKNNQSGHKGVSWDKRNGKWRAVITVNRKQIHIGRFDDINKAIEKHREASIAHFGEFARV